MVRFQKKNERKGKKATVLAVLILVGGGVYFVASGGASSLIERFHPQIHKKLISVKPKILRTAHKAERNPFSEDEFTFFRVLNDAEMDQLVGLNGEVGPRQTVAPQRPVKRKLQRVRTAPRRQQSRPKPVSQPAPVLAKAVPAAPVLAKAAPMPVPGEMKAPAAEVKPAEPAKPAPPAAKIPTSLEKFTVQVSSFKESRYAQALKDKLMKKGYPAFTLKSELAGKNEFRHRVYIGRYQSHTSAARAASKIRQAEKLGTLIVQHRK